MMDTDIAKINKQFRKMIRRLPGRQMIAVLAVLACGTVGTSLLTQSHASTPTASVEVESGARSSCATTIPDNTASGGQAVKFNDCSASSGNPSADAGASLPISYSLSSLTGTVLYVSPTGSDSASGAVASPYATLAKAVSAAPSGATIVLRGGTYRQGGVNVNKTLKVIAYPGETPVFNGAVAVLGGWTVSGSQSYHSYTPMPVSDGAGISFTTCANQTSSCLGKYPDQVWVGGSQLQQVGDQGSVATGKFWVDTTNNRLYMATTDVNSGNIEVSGQRWLLNVTASSVTLQGFKAIRYSNTASDYGVFKFSGTADNALMQDIYESDTAFMAVSFGPSGSDLNTGSTIKDSTIGYSNWMGVSANATTDFTLDHDDISSMNQFNEFTTSPQSGALKTSRTWHTKVLNSKINNNKSQGLWFDQSNYDVVIANNDIENNTGSSVFFEISNFVYAVNNYIKPAPGGYAMKIPGTSDVYLVNNTLVGGIPLVVATDNRSIPGCSDPAQPVCANSLSSDRDTYHTHLPTMTWIPGIDLSLNNIIVYPTTGNYCGTTVPFCITLTNSSASVALNEIIHPADPGNSVPQTLIDGTVYANGSGNAATVGKTNYANGSAFAAAMAGTPVNISGFEAHGYTGNQYVEADGTPTSTLSALHTNAVPIPVNATINRYMPSGVKHYGVTWK